MPDRGISRRRLLQLSVLLGADVALPHLMPVGYQPVALAAELLPGKDGLTVLNDRPLNAETPAHLLNSEVTPTNRMFVRNNGIPPKRVSLNQWRLVIDGEAARKTRVYSLADLRKRFKNISLQLTLECGGNGRAEFDPQVPGNQWTLGAVGCPSWQGIRLADVLEDAGVKNNAVYIGYYGADKHLSGDPGKQSISRGVPIDKALEAESMIAWGMNYGPLHPANGAPLRLVIGGAPASVSGKWLERIAIRDRIHDGAKMTGSSYRIPREPVAPGTAVADRDMAIIETMPVKSLITSPETGVRHPVNEPLKLNGHAWCGDAEVERVALSIDFGQTWRDIDVTRPVNRYAWQHFSAEITLPGPGYYEVWARATDTAGDMQPMVLPGWNPKGYLNNACHRIAVYAV